MSRKFAVVAGAVLLALAPAGCGRSRDALTVSRFGAVSGPGRVPRPGRATPLWTTRGTRLLHRLRSPTGGPSRGPGR
jgi:hypothetical protein